MSTAARSSRAQLPSSSQGDDLGEDSEATAGSRPPGHGRLADEDGGELRISPRASPVAAWEILGLDRRGGVVSIRRASPSSGAYRVGTSPRPRGGSALFAHPFDVRPEDLAAHNSGSVEPALPPRTNPGSRRARPASGCSDGSALTRSVATDRAAASRPGPRRAGSPRPTRLRLLTRSTRPSRSRTSPPGVLRAGGRAPGADGATRRWPPAPRACRPRGPRQQGARRAAAPPRPPTCSDGRAHHAAPPIARRWWTDALATSPDRVDGGEPAGELRDGWDPSPRTPRALDRAVEPAHPRQGRPRRGNAAGREMMAQADGRRAHLGMPGGDGHGGSGRKASPACDCRRGRRAPAADDRSASSSQPMQIRRGDLTRGAREPQGDRSASARSATASSSRPSAILTWLISSVAAGRPPHRSAARSIAPLWAATLGDPPETEVQIGRQGEPAGVVGMRRGEAVDDRQPRPAGRRRAGRGPSTSTSAARICARALGRRPRATAGRPASRGRRAGGVAPTLGGSGQVQAGLARHVVQLAVRSGATAASIAASSGRPGVSSPTGRPSSVRTVGVTSSRVAFVDQLVSADQRAGRRTIPAACQPIGSWAGCPSGSSGRAARPT